jgi:hypothetical protein
MELWSACPVIRNGKIAVQVVKFAFAVLGLAHFD